MERGRIGAEERRLVCLRRTEEQGFNQAMTCYIIYV